MELHLVSDNEETITEAFTMGLLAWIMESDSGVESLERLSKVINGVTSGIAHKASTSGQEVFDLNNEDEWATSPKEIMQFLIDRDLLWDKEKLAESWTAFLEYKMLEDMFNTPSVDTEEDESGN